METLTKSLHSISYFLSLIFSWSLHTSKRHIGDSFTVDDQKTYRVFYETISDRGYDQKEVTLVIGFRLKLIGKNSFFHWLFQHLCIFDTPIWVGFQGFKIKYWMVEPDSKDYLGLYCYQGKENAKRYAEYICAVLKPLSVPGTVWYKIHEQDFRAYETGHSAEIGEQV